MALPEISTGYKPTGALGALYQGFNAADAEQSSELERIRQFLANQKAQEMQPIEIAQAQQNLDKDTYKTDPRYKDAMLRTQLGQADLQTASGSKAQALLPFAIAAERAKQQREATEQGLFGKMYKGIEQQHNQSMPEAQREAGAQGAYILADTLSRVDPKIMAQERMLADRLASQEDLTKLRVEGKQGPGKDPYIEFNKLSPEKRLGVMEWALNGNINPVTRQPMGDVEKDQWISFYNRDLEAYNAKLQSTQGGKANISEVTKGQVPTYPLASAGTPKAIGTQQTPPKQETKMTIDTLRSMYPGIPDDKLRQAYKKKFGEDL